MVARGQAVIHKEQHAECRVTLGLHTAPIGPIRPMATKANFVLDNGHNFDNDVKAEFLLDSELALSKI